MVKYLKLLFLFKNIIDEKDEAEKQGIKFWEHQRFVATCVGFLSAVLVVQYSLPAMTANEQAQLTDLFLNFGVPFLTGLYATIQFIIGQIKAQKRKKDAAN